MTQGRGRSFEWSAATRGAPGRISLKAGGVGHVLSGVILPTGCGRIFDPSRLAGSQFWIAPSTRA